MSTNYGFEPTLDGLNNIDSDSTTTNNIICNILLVNTTANAPTVAPSSNDTSVATTAWITAHAGGAYVTIGTTQTVTGEKTFSNANTFITGNTITNSIQPNGITTNVNIATTQSTGVLDIGTLTARTGAINIGSGASAKTITLNSSTVGTTTIRGQFAQLRPAVNGTCSIGDNMSSGTVQIGRGDTNASTTTINIGTGSIITSPINIGTGRTTAGTVSIGSSQSTTNTVAINSNTINIGTVSPVLATNTINVGNGQTGSLVNVLNEMDVYGDLLVSNIVNNIAGTNLTLTAPADDIIITSADKIDLNSITTNISGTLFSTNIGSPLGTDLLVSAAGLTDTLTLIGGNAIDLIGTTNITGTLATTGQTSAGSIMTNTYNPFLATDDVNINPTQTSGSLNLGTKIDRSGIIQIGNGLNATCDIRIGTARNTGGAVSVGSNNSIANTLNLQSALINVGTGSPIGTANTINIGNGNAGSLIDLKNDTTITGTTNINTTGTSATGIGNSTGSLTLTAGTQTTNAVAEIRQNIGGVAKLQLLPNTSYLYGGTALELWSDAIQRVRITSSGIQFNSYQFNNIGTYPVGSASATGYFTSTTTTTKMTASNADLASITIGSIPGCYLVEGGFQFGSVFLTEAFTFLSLSTTSATLDSTRIMVLAQANQAGDYGNRITSIFNVNGATTFYLVGRTQTALGATNTQSNYLAITKIA